MKQHEKLDLLEFARMVKDGQDITEAEYLDLMRRVLPLDSLKNITPEESEWLFGAVSWLHDYSLLLWEFHRVEVGADVVSDGHPVIPGPSGPLITNLLTRSGDRTDFSQLEDFGAGRSDGT